MSATVADALALVALCIDAKPCLDAGHVDSDAVDAVVDFVDGHGDVAQLAIVLALMHADAVTDGDSALRLPPRSPLQLESLLLRLRAHELPVGVNH